MSTKEFKIIVDTREQLSLWVKNVVRKKLDVGDYSTTLLQNKFCIERKSPQDLYGSLIQGHVRFMNEIYRAERRGIKLALYVECTYETFISMTWYGGSRLKMRPENLKKIVDTTIRRRAENGLEVVWCKSRGCMKRMVKLRLLVENCKFRPERKIPIAGKRKKVKSIKAPHLTPGVKK
jgi:ERCC4-type nuclease